MRWRPSVRSVLVLLTTVVLFSPMAGIFALRIYDTELIRQTEAELIAQAAFVEAVFASHHAACADQRGLDLQTLGLHAPAPEIDVAPDGSRRFRPVPLAIDLRSAVVLPVASEPDGAAALAPCADVAGVALTPILVAAQEVTLAGIRVTDHHGVVAASTRQEDVAKVWRPLEVDAALEGRMTRNLRYRQSTNPDPPLDSFSRRGGLRVFVGFPIWSKNGRVVGSVVVSRTPISLQKALYNNASMFAAFGVALLALAAGFLGLAFATLGRPVNALMGQIRLISRGEAGRPIERPGTREFAQLSDALARMDDALRARNAYIRNFARNVSHEFKTPLTSMRGAVELLQEFDDMPVERRQAFLDNVLADTHRLERLVNRLHELARAETTRTHETADVREVLEAIAAHYRDDDVDIEVVPDGDAPCEVAVAADVFDSMVRNLVENARTHGAPPIVLRWRRTIGAVEIEVEDAGPGISEANQDRIFDTFFTTARETGGTGLGLSIVRALAEQHGGHLSLSS